MKTLMCPLFVPANRPHRFQTAASSGADAILVDLEDAVSPEAETAPGVANAAAIAAHPNVVQLAFRPADFFMDLGLAASKELTRRTICRLAIASRAAGKPLPLDGPCFAINDFGVPADECVTALESGAAGKLCIHPSQPFVVRNHFLPTEAEIVWAERIMASYSGAGVGVVDGKVVDPPIRAYAGAILERARSKPGRKE